MRILVIGHGVSPFGHHYVRVFRELGHEADFVSMTPYEAEPSEAVKVLGPPDFKPWETSDRLWPYVKSIRPLRRLVREFRPDVVFALYLSSAGLMASLSGAPHIVLSARGGDLVSRAGSRLWRAVLRWMARRADLVHAVSQPLAEILERRAGVDPAKLLVCPLGVDTSRLPLVDPARRPNTGQILSTRAHKPIYDQGTVVRALGRLKERGIPFHMTFVDFFETERTRELVQGRGLSDHVTFRPQYNPQEVHQVLSQADVYVSASLSDGTSNSLLEAMSTGTLPVVTDIPANRPWVEHGRTGLLFPPGDDAALADRLAEALARPDLRAAAAPLNRQVVVERGDLRRQADKLLAAFERCLKA